MATCYLSALWGAGAQLFDDQGVVLAGGFIKTYLAGTSTPSPTFTDSTGVTSNGVAIELDGAGRPPQELWIPTGVSLKFILTDADDVPVGITYDNISGIGDPGGGVSAVNVWSNFAGAPSYINATQFSVTGDQTNTFRVGTRIKATVTAGTIYGTVSASAYTSFTTVTIIPDSTSLDAGLSAVAVSINTVEGKNVSSAAVDYKGSITYPADSIGAGVASLGQATTTAGTSTAFTLAPPISIAAYVSGKAWLVKFNQASGANPTLNIDGVGPIDLKQYNGSGSKVDAVVYANQISNVVYDGTDMVVIDAITANRLLRVTNYISNDTWTRESDVSYIVVDVQAAGGGAYSGGGGGGGGGAGGFSRKLITSPPATAAVVVGVGGASGAPGASGGDSTFDVTAVIAKGGTAGGTGTGIVGSSGGAGGSVTGAAGDMIIPGGGGGYGGAWVSQTFFGHGGNSFYGGGAEASITRSAGINGGANTGGGGSGGTAGGGSGANGRVTVYEYA